MASEPWIYDEHPSMFRNNPAMFVLLAISVIGFIAIGIWWIRCKGIRLALNRHEILFEKGLLAKQRTQLNLSSIRTVRITQSAFQRLFGVGDIEIFSAGDRAEIAVRGMPRPAQVRALASAQFDD